MPEPQGNGSPSHWLTWKRLSNLGVSLIPLLPKSKIPFEQGWTQADTYTWTQLQPTLKPDSNVGIRSGYPSKLVNNDYLICIDLDISDPTKADEAYEALEKFFPEYKNSLTVKSGSNSGLSRHFLLTTDKPIASKVVTRSQGKYLKGETLKSCWQIEVIANSKQFVAVGSIHPDGNSYIPLEPDKFERFLQEVQSKERTFNFISNARLSELVFVKPKDDSFEEKTIIELKTIEEIKDILSRLPPDYATPYESWFETACALHHQFEGSDIGLGLFKEFSATSPNYNEAGCERTWGSIKGNPNRDRTTLGTIIKVGNEYSDGIAYSKALGDNDIPAEDKLWMNRLDRVKVTFKRNGLALVKPSLKNIVLILQNDKRFAGLIWQNTLSGRTVFRRSLLALTEGMFKMVPTDPFNGDEWADKHDMNLLMFFLSGKDPSAWYMPTLSVNTLAQAINQVGVLNPFHPIQEYLKSQPWDGQERLDTCLITFLGCEDNAYTRDLSRKFLTGAVARVFEPGCKFDMTMIIEGLQGIMKSTFIEVLAVNSKWYATTVYTGGLGASKIVENIQSKWFIELSEMTGMRSADITELKHFLSNTTDRMRLPYDRRSMDFPRQCVFIGTTNEFDYLHDKTGNRRFHPIEAKSVDITNLREQLPQLWAEAYRAYQELRATTPKNNSLPLFIEEGTEALEIVEAMRNDRMEDSPADGLADRIILWLDKKRNNEFMRNMVSAPQVWVEALNRDMRDFGKGSGKIIVNAMAQVPHWRSMGRQRTRVGGRTRLWCRNDAKNYTPNDYYWAGLSEAEAASEAAGNAGI
jgi:hypothetical protein